MNSGTIKTLTNSGTISGGKGGSSLAGGSGGAGVMNSGTIKALTSSGTISGGAGGKFDGAGGAGIWNSGVIGPLANSGVIEGGLGSTGGAMGDAIYSAGPHASIGPITNSGQIIGNVVIDNEAKVTVHGGTGTTFGSWKGGTITIGAGDLTFASGNTALGDDISVDGGAGTVTNMAALRLAAPQTIAGNFLQTAAGVLGLDFAADVWGEYGALTTTKLTTLDGGLAIDLTDDFKLETHDTFDILGFASLAGGFDALCARRRGLQHGETQGFVDLRRRRASEGSFHPDVARPCRNAWRPGGLAQFAHSRTLDVGDARLGLPRPRWLRPKAQERRAPQNCVCRFTRRSITSGLKLDPRRPL